MSKLVVLRTYPDRLHAELASSFLESEGIESHVSSPSQLPGSYLIAEWGDGLIPHELKVFEDDLQAAEDILAETETGESAIDDDENPLPAAEETSPGTPGVCRVCGGNPSRPDRIIDVYIKGAIGATVLYIVVALACLPFTSGINVWAALSILGFIIPTALFVVRGFFVRARCGFCGQLRMPKANPE